ncbi:arylamine N-acetyltransferase family protein [Bordetella genomosp. 13]|uniref:arylamine N-acetyltransferase family protein n=1 Tax=Bordetella genomosp. 13 TaxID=463040 RepID=UPI0011A09C77|nr:arylamine N-acetyltransferase [Bordetella genomosp. 13]
MSDATLWDNYLQRIGLTAWPAATLDGVASLVLHHVRAIPFENLDPLLRRPVRLELSDLHRKLVDEQRGGYCYEHNLLFGAALRELGFAVTDLAAAVLWAHPEDAVTPRTHMLLQAKIDGQPHIVDVGFGAMTLTGVLRQEPGAQSTPHGDFRLVPGNEGSWRMQARVGDEWRTLYRYDQQAQTLPDYLVASHFVSTYPDSMFIRDLMAARAVPGLRLALRNRDYTRYAPDGTAQRRRLADAAEIRDVLVRDFGIRLPPDSYLNKVLDGLPD